jgi:hypothetical protein
MKVLPEISDKYNNVEWLLTYMSFNETIGNEDVEPIRYFHCFWKGKLSDLHFMSLKSLHELHPEANVIIWTPDALEAQGSYAWIKIKKLLKVKVNLIQLTQEHFNQANAPQLFSKYVMLLLPPIDINAKYNAQVAYASDIVRFVVLYLYGGVWFDLDVLFLRNFDSIKIKRYTSQWGTDDCGNAAIMRLEKGHDLIQKILGKYDRPFYPTTTFRLENDLDLTMLPSTFFDILWRGPDSIPDHLQFEDFDEFFELTEWKMPEQLYAYHWHNRWNKPVPKFFKL